VGIGDCFIKLINRVTITDTEWTAITGHADEIGIRLKKNFGITEVRRLGSHERGTAIHNYSDLDLFMVLKKSEVTRGGQIVGSNTVLENVRLDLIKRYQSTNLGRDGQAITIRFSDGTAVDVVPALFEGINQTYKRPWYSIPDGQGGWIATSPDSHTAYIQNAHAASGNKFIFIVRLIKFWRECRNPRTPLNSFHAELLFADQSTFSGVKSYAQCVHDAFALLCQRKCRGMQDPLGISGLVAAASTQSKLNLVYEHAQVSLEKADKALGAEIGGDNVTARYYWDLVFNGGFPAL